MASDRAIGIPPRFGKLAASERVLRPARDRLAEAIVCVTGLSLEAARRAAECGVTVVRDALSMSPEPRWLFRWVGEGDGRPRATALAITNPREAWEAMATAGLIGAGDVECERRRFEAEASGGLPVGAYDYEARGDRAVVLQPHPATVADCVAFAADWPNVLRAEAIARECYPLRTRSGVIWRVAPLGRVGITDLRVLGYDIAGVAASQLPADAVNAGVLTLLAPPLGA